MQISGGVNAMQCEKFSFLLHQYHCSLMWWTEQNPYIFIVHGLILIGIASYFTPFKKIVCLFKGHDGVVIDNVINKIWKCKRCGKWNYWEKK